MVEFLISCGNLILKTSLCLHSLSLVPDHTWYRGDTVVLVAHNHSHSQWAQTDHSHEVLLPTGQRTNYRTAVPSESDRTRCVPCGRPCLQRPLALPAFFWRSVRFEVSSVQLVLLSLVECLSCNVRFPRHAFCCFVYLFNYYLDLCLRRMCV